MLKTKVLFLYPNLQLMPILPAGVSSLVGYLRNKKIDVELFDTTFYKINEKSSDEDRAEMCQFPKTNFKDKGITYKTTDMIEDFYKKVEEFKPHILAISWNDFTHIIAEKIIKGFKIKYPNIHVIAGGLFSTFWPEIAIKNPDVDVICRGEGYEVFYEYITKLSNKESIDTIEGLWSKKIENNVIKIIDNPIRPPVCLNDLPFDDFSIYEEKRLYRPMFGKMLKIIPMWTDIGCPYQCKYCIAPALKNLYSDMGYTYFRHKSVDRIIDELQFYKKSYEPDYIYFLSETILAYPKEGLRRLADLYNEEIGLPFWCESRVETITEENAFLLKHMGVDRISIGLESGNEDYRRNVLKKTFTNDQFIKAIKILKKFGIACTINNIVGLPDENREMIFDTINLNRRIIKNSITPINMSISSYVPIGGTELQQYCLDKGYYNLDEYLSMDTGKGFHQQTFLNMPQITGTEIFGLLRTFPLYVKLSKRYYDDIKIAESMTKEGNEKFEELTNIYWSLVKKPVSKKYNYKYDLTYLTKRRK